MDLATQSAFWSMLAALGSLIVSVLLVWFDHRRTLEDIQPDPVIDGIERLMKDDGVGRREVVVFRQIKNIGKGTATRIVFQTGPQSGGEGAIPLIGANSPIILSPLAAGESAIIGHEISLFWQNTKGEHRIFIDIEIASWNIRENPYMTKYRLMIVDNPVNFTIGNLPVLAPGVVLIERRPTMHGRPFSFKRFRRKDLFEV